MKVEVGQIYKDRDKRVGERYFKVWAIDGEKARMMRVRSDGHELPFFTRISIRRLERQQGWIKVEASNL